MKRLIMGYYSNIFTSDANGEEESPAYLPFSKVLSTRCTWVKLGEKCDEGLHVLALLGRGFSRVVSSHCV